MKTIATTALFISVTSLTFASPAEASTTQYRWGEGQSIEIQGSGAKLRLRAWSQNRIRVQSKLSRQLDQVSVVRGPNGIEIRLVPLAKNQQVYGEIIVDIPASAPLSVFTLSGDVEIVGARGALHVTSLDADVSARDIRSREVSIRSTSGAVELSAEALAQLSVETVTGRISYAGNLAPGADCTLKSISGEVEIVDDPGLAALGVLDSSLARAH